MKAKCIYNAGLELALTLGKIYEVEIQLPNPYNYIRVLDDDRGASRNVDSTRMEIVKPMKAKCIVATGLQYCLTLNKIYEVKPVANQGNDKVINVLDDYGNWIDILAYRMEILPETNACPTEPSMKASAEIQEVPDWKIIANITKPKGACPCGIVSPPCKYHS